jgi:hypothetical protein
VSGYGLIPSKKPDAPARKPQRLPSSRLIENVPANQRERFVHHLPAATFPIKANDITARKGNNFPITKLPANREWSDMQ